MGPPLPAQACHLPWLSGTPKPLVPREQQAIPGNASHHSVPVVTICVRQGWRCSAAEYSWNTRAKGITRRARSWRWRQRQVSRAGRSARAALLSQAVDRLPSLLKARGGKLTCSNGSSPRAHEQRAVCTSEIDDSRNDEMGANSILQMRHRRARAVILVGRPSAVLSPFAFLSLPSFGQHSLIQPAVPVFQPARQSGSDSFSLAWAAAARRWAICRAWTTARRG